jgi:hypothetical protein
MKKLFFAALITISFYSSAFAFKANKKVDIRAKENFEMDFRDASNATWKVFASYAQVEFTVDDKKVTAFYDNDGELIGSSYKISLNDLPTRAKRTFAKKYSDYPVTEAVRFEFKDHISYFISVVKEGASEIVKVDDAGVISTVQKK